MEKAIGSNTRRTIILPSIHRWKVALDQALRHAFLPSCFSRSSPGRTRFDRPGRVEEVLFSLSLSLALPLLPPTSGINRALVRPRWTHLLRSCRNRPLSRTTRVRVRPVDLNPLAFPRDISNPTLFHFCRSWCFRWRARGERFFFLNLIWSLKFFSKMGKKDLRKLNPSLGKFFSTVGNGGI